MGYKMTLEGSKNLGENLLWLMSLLVRVAAELCLQDDLSRIWEIHPSILRQSTGRHNSSYIIHLQREIIPRAHHMLRAP